MANKIQFSASSDQIRLETGTNDVGLKEDTVDLLTDLISVWEMDETSGTNMEDSHGSNDGTSTNATVNQTGIINKCYDWPGNNSYGNMGNIFNFGLNDNFTISMWIKGSPDLALHHAWNKRHLSTPYQGMWVYYESRTIYVDSSGAERDYSYTFFVDIGASSINISTGKNSVTSTDTDWHLITVYRSGTTIGIALDDNAPKTYTNASLNADISTTNNYYIATKRDASQWWDGKIDQTAGWDRALTTEQISELYNSGAGLAYSSWT